MADKITKDMTFHQVLQEHPGAAKVLAGFNLGCVGCMGAANETLEQGAMAHGIDVNEIVQALNDAPTE
ncbi:MAG: disulfide oxidoreductase [Desulfuromonas sp.]|nr:MAG: disulfide oxidoreductase [Desulfuromonas sp.]